MTRKSRWTEFTTGAEMGAIVQESVTAWMSASGFRMVPRDERSPQQLALQEEMCDLRDAAHKALEEHTIYCKAGYYLVRAIGAIGTPGPYNHL